MINHEPLLPLVFIGGHSVQAAEETERLLESFTGNEKELLVAGFKPATLDAKVRKHLGELEGFDD